MKMHFIKSNEKKDIILKLKEQFGITQLPYLLIEAGKDKVRAFSGDLSKEELYELGRLTRIETVGIYILKKETPIRISFDAPHLLSSQIDNHIIEIDEKQANHWLHGADLDIIKPSGTYVISFEGNFIGLGKSNSERIINHVPKDRRLRN